jgi:hypothetical protein
MSDFKLTMQDAPRMNERLQDLDDLKGETILAAFKAFDTITGDVVIVTDTFNWLVLETESSGCGEDASVEVKRDWGSLPKTLADFVNPKPLFEMGCINHAVFVELESVRIAREQNHNARRADYFRAQLAELGGS